MGEAGSEKTVHWITVLIAFSAIIVVHELGHFLAARLVGVRVEKFSIGFGPALLKFKKKETEFLISVIPVGGYVKLAGEDITDKTTGKQDELFSKTTFQRFIVFVNGAFFNLISAFIVISFLFMAGSASVPSKSGIIGQVNKDYPAQKAGIKSGDIVLSIDKRKVKSWDEITSIIHKNDGIPIALEIKRVDKVFTVMVTPIKEAHKDIFGRDIKMSFIGIAPEMINKKFGIFAAIWEGAKSTLFWTGKTYQGLWLIITRQVSLKGAAGPIGIIAMTGAAAKTGIKALMALWFIISINLGVINLLPFPVLDGGHILFLVLEKFRRKPLTQRTQEIITQIAFYLLIALFVLVSYNDLHRLGVIKNITRLYDKRP